MRRTHQTTPAVSRSPQRSRATPLLVLAATLALAGGTAAVASSPNLQPFQDPTGIVRTYSTTGSIDTANPFFQSLGTNGRSCGTCHQQGDAWSVTPPHLLDRFNKTNGTDPIFRTNDGSNSPNADVSTVAARRSAYSMLLGKGVIRIGIGIPAGAEFHLVAVDDPYQYASAQELSLFRRPLPSTNLIFLSAVMWDGRESIEKIATSHGSNTQALIDDLKHQAMDATLGHAQATASPSDAQLQAIASFQLAHFTAQSVDNAAGNLGQDGALGGPQSLSKQDFFIGINDPLGQNPTGAAFNPSAFTLYNGWSNLSGTDSETLARESVVRGQALFNTRPITITGVAGLNGPADSIVGPIQGTCTTCHDAPNVGNHSVVAPLNIGLTGDHPEALPRTPDLPLYTLQCDSGPLAGQTFRTTDPGRALISGKCADIGKFKGPILRGLAGRAPYFHNGSAATLDDVVNFYNNRFGMGLTAQQHADLVAFLRAL